MRYLFGARNSDLLKAILHDTDSTYLNWALGAVIHWHFDEDVENLYMIHGDEDRILPHTSETITLI